MEPALKNSNEIIWKHRKLRLKVPGKVFSQSGLTVIKSDFQFLYLSKKFLYWKIVHIITISSSPSHTLHCPSTQKWLHGPFRHHMGLRSLLWFPTLHCPSTQKWLSPFRHHKGPRSLLCFPTLHCPSTQKWLWSFSSSQGTPFSTLFSYLTLPVYTEVAMVLFVITRDPVLYCFPTLHCPSTQKWLWSFSSSQGTPFSTLFSYLTLPVYTEVAMVLFVITRDPVLYSVSYLTLAVYTEVAMFLFVITWDPVLYTVFLPYTARLHRSGYGPFRHHVGPRSLHCFPTLHCPSTQKWLWSFSSSQGTPFSTLFSYLTLPVYTEVTMVLFVITRDPVLHTVFQLHVKSIVQRPARKSTLFISCNNI